MSKKTIIIYCHCAYYQIIPDSVKLAVLDALENAGEEFEAVPDLCEMCAKRDPALKSWAEADQIKIIACYPRAVKWLFSSAGAPLPQEGVEFLNMRIDSIEKIISSLIIEKSHLANSKFETCPERSRGILNFKFPPLADWIPWFPVIDRDLCKSCKQCFNFCLFGVYTLTENGRVVVTNPASCKTNCPACARMCPHSAIIFPKCADSPINGDKVDMTLAASKTQNSKLWKRESGLKTQN